MRLVASTEDDNALLRVINLPARGVGARSIEQIQEASRREGINLWQAACTHPPAGKAGTGVATFIRLIEDLRRVCEAMTLPQAVEHAIKASGLRAMYESEKDGQDRIDNMNELITAATVFAEDPVASLALDDEGNVVVDATAGADWLAVLNNFLSHAALEAGEHQAGEGQDALQLMTVHAAKGLEFHSVFVTGLEEGLFPHENSLNDADGTEEERRLMYVALTRARRRLYLTAAQTRMLHGQMRYNIASRFIEELPSELLRRLTPPAHFARGAGTAPTATPFTPSRGGFGAGPVRQPDADIPWRIGQGVSHPKFGYGVIVSAEGRGEDARVQVNFREVGMKWLALQYAKLTAA